MTETEEYEWSIDSSGDDDDDGGDWEYDNNDDDDGGLFPNFLNHRPGDNMDATTIPKHYPYVCITIAIVSVLLFVVRSIFAPTALDFLTLVPDRVIWHNEWHRCLSHHLLHVDAEHLVMNLLCILTEGRALEQTHGSYPLLVVTSWSAILISVVYCVLTCAVQFYVANSGDEEDDAYWLAEEIQGFSGILFHWVVWDASQSLSHTFGFAFLEDIPPSVYPWVALFVLYLYDPENDLGHLMHFSGIIVGYLHTKGYLDGVLPDCLVQHQPQNHGSERSQPPQQLPKQERQRSDGSRNLQKAPSKATAPAVSPNKARDSDLRQRRNLTPREESSNATAKSSLENRIRAARLKRFQ